MDTLKSLENYAREHHIPVLLPDTAKYLEDFCVKNQPKKILEIGTAIGYSGSIMLLSSLNSHLTTIEKDVFSFEIAKENFKKAGVEDRVKQIFMDAKDAIKILNEKYDLIFLDGPKGQYKNYLPYLIKLLNDGGTLIADNVLFHGLVEKEGVPAKKHRTIVVNLREFILMLKNNDILETKLLHIGDGLTVSKKD